MNERIKLLAEQSGSTHKQNLGVYQFYTDELEKFAELIVAQCAQLADDCPADYLSQPYKYPSTYIKEYFGV
jgi:hypothetical protein